MRTTVQSYNTTQQDKLSLQYCFIHPSSPLLLALLLSMLFIYSSNSLSNDSNIESREAMEYFFHQSFNNLEEELKIANEEKKSGVFIMFSDKDCPWCAKMKTTVMDKVVVQNYYRKHFQVIHIDINGNTMMADFKGDELTEKDYAFKYHRVRATPVVMFFDSSGKRVVRFTGIVRNTKEFLLLGEYAVTQSYKQETFTSYKRSRKNNVSVPN